MRKTAGLGHRLVPATVNGRAGLVATADDRPITVISFDVADGRIVACYLVRNPDKLARITLT